MQRSRKLQHQSAPSLRRKSKRGAGVCDCGDGSNEILWIIRAAFLFFLFAAGGIAYEFFYNNLLPTEETQPDFSPNVAENARGLAVAASATTLPPHLQQIAPVLPIFAPVENAEELMDDLVNHQRPTMAGITALLQKFLAEFHAANQKLADRSNHATDMTVIQTYFDLTNNILAPFEQAYRDKPIFPIRKDESIFLSLAAFREHLLADTLVFAFSKAKHPEKLFVGAVVQNCFGRVMEDGVTVDTSGLPCKTGAQVIGKNKQGRDMTKVSDAPPDKNGIADFCAMPDYKKYCENGQVRVLYVHETESVGPAVARYHASKLWGGEQFFMQCDSHLMFAADWDAKYIAEVKITRNYPKSVLSSYPPGFQGVNANQEVKETSGTRLCHCETRVEDPNPIVRINSGAGYHGDEPRPTQIPFIAAGFFFAHAEFLVDVPFDPYMPWLFMGEEIALSMRAWTHGWDIYAPRKNLIAHQYRPGRMGLPKFWGTVNRFYPPGINNNVLQSKVIKRTKNMVGYPDSTLKRIDAEGINVVLTDIEHYSFGADRSWDDYMKHAYMHVDEEHDAIDCSRNQWCNQGLKD